MIEELRRFLVQECGVPDDSVLDTILVAQHALLPAYDREYPFTVELQHDVVAWHSQMLAAKAVGHWQDWESVVPPLSSFCTGRLDVNDVDGAVTRTLGCDLIMTCTGVNWDLDSGIARARVNQETAPAWVVASLGFSYKSDTIHVS